MGARRSPSIEQVVHVFPDEDLGLLRDDRPFSEVLDSTTDTMRTITGVVSPPADDAPPTDGTVDDMIDWINGDTERARTALELEEARPEPRERLLAYVEGMLNTPD